MSEESKEMNPAERLVWLRERGIVVETAEERKLKKIQDIMNEKEIGTIDGEEYEDLSFVHVPHDESLPLKELSIKVSQNRLGKGDLLIEELKPYFSALSKKVDLSLFKKNQHGTKTLGSTVDGSDDIQVSEEALQKVAEEGQVEVFCLVHPMPSNKYQSVNIYLDEIGMLKRLPMNKRAADFALRSGFNPAPKFYGDVFLGRVTQKPVLRNMSFKIGSDTSPDAEWIQKATMENIEYQTEMNQITGQGDTLQPCADGENGIAKEEQGGYYSWTQTDEEIEIILPLSSNDNNPEVEKKVLTSTDVKKGGLKVKFFPRKLIVSFHQKEILKMDFYDSVDPDGCTWTLEVGSQKKDTCLVISCEKSNEMSWPRITL